MKTADIIKILKEIDIYCPKRVKERVANILFEYWEKNKDEIQTH